MQEITETLIMPTAEATSALAQYKLLREAGRGGMSVVYEARDEKTGRTVAVKVLAAPPGLAPAQRRDMQARFQREAEAVARLSHPNVVAIHELGEQAGQHFLVMEFLRGQTLRDRLEAGALTPAQALPVLRQVAAALDAVHAQGVVHRDIKPSNVMLLADGTAKLLDFGVARQSDDTTITTAGALIGSPAYMSPEQVRGEAGTPASDLWALGALLYEMLAGQPPFTGQSIPSVLYQVTHTAPNRILSLPAPAQRVLRRALNKNPQRRYPTARALADALGACLVRPRAVPPLGRRQWAALVLLLVAGIGLTVATLRHRHGGTTSPAAVVPLSLANPAPGAATITPAPAASPKSRQAAAPPGRIQHTPARHALVSKRPKAHIAPHRAARTASRKQPAAKHRTIAARPVSRTATPRHGRHMVRAHRRGATIQYRAYREARRRSLDVYGRAYVGARRAPRRAHGGFDAAASQRLQRFIWSEGR